MMCCENCRYAIYDSVPYGMTSCNYLSGCKKEDEMTEKQCDDMCENDVGSLWEEIEYDEYARCD